MARTATEAPAREAKRNAPPPVTLPTKDEIQAWLEHEYATMQARSAEILKTLGTLNAAYEVVENDEDQAVLTDARKQAQTLIDTATKAKASSKKPLREMATWFDDFFVEMATKVAGAVDPIKEKMNAYAVEQARVRREAMEAELERKRKEAEAARAKAAEAMFQEPERVADRRLAQAEKAERQVQRAEAQATARPADMTRVTGDFGATSSLREFLDVEVSDPLLVPPEFLKIDLQLIRQKAREIWGDPDMKVKMREGFQPIRGVRCTIRQETVVR